MPGEEVFIGIARDIVEARYRERGIALLDGELERAINTAGSRSSFYPDQGAWIDAIDRTIADWRADVRRFAVEAGWMSPQIEEELLVHEAIERGWARKPDDLP